jgi:hypothetical protein
MLQLLDVVNLALLAGSFDHGGQIDNYELLVSLRMSMPYPKRLTRQIKWEVDASQHDGKENIPSTQTSNKGKGTRCFLTLCSNRHVALGSVQEGAGKETKGRDKGEKDEEEDEVGADGADEVDETEDAHADHEVACCSC